MPNERASTFLDQGERFLLCALFFAMAHRFVTAFLADGAYINLLYLLDQFIIFAFVLVRRPAQTISRSPYDWALAFGASYLPMLLSPANLSAGLISPAAASSLMLGGVAIHLAAKFTLRRSFGVVAANRKVGGAYRFVRHPMYTGYVMNHIGFLMVFFSAWNLAVYLVAWVLLYLRAIEEEKFLLQDPQYVDYASKVKARMIPGLV